MKKIGFLFIAVTMMLTMSACDFRLGGFGAGMVNNNGNRHYRSKKEPVRAIMVDGSIYFETGEDNDIPGDFGVFDGKFEKAVDKWELPKRDNEANFDIINKNSSGYRFGSREGTIEVLIGDDWEIFKKIEDSEEDILKYKYIFKVEGETEYYHDESEYIILSDNLEVTANDVEKSLHGSDINEDIYVVVQDLD